MQNLEIVQASVNSAVLESELRTGLGDKFVGFSTGRGMVVVHLTDSVTEDDLALTQSIVTDHDATELTPRQIRQQTRQQAIQTARSQFTQPLDATDYSGESADIQALVNRVIWLEQEIRDLRGLNES